MSGFGMAVLFGGLAVVLGSPGPTLALEMRPILTLDIARKVVDGCLAKAQQQEWKMHVAVLALAAT